MLATARVAVPPPVLVSPPVPLTVEFKSRAPPLTAKAALVASAMGMSTDWVPPLTVTVAVPLLPFERQAAAGERVTGIAEAQGIEAGRRSR